MPPDKKVRLITVLNRGRESYRQPPVPDIRMSGAWLARAGFTAGCILAVAVEQGRLVVTVEARPRPLPERRLAGEIRDVDAKAKRYGKC